VFAAPDLNPHKHLEIYAMPEKKIIVVTGATGAQGGALANAILEDAGSEFAVRALTRDPSSEKARRLADLGAEVVKGDISDQASLDRAFAGAYGAFCVTFFWDHFSPERETADARRMAEAAKRAGLQHVIWSTLEDTRKLIPLDDQRMPTLQGSYKVPHLDAKGEADARFAELGVPTTYLLTSFYWENFIYFGMGPRKGPDGGLVLALPIGQAKLPGIAALDIGRCSYGILKRGSAMVGRRIGVAGEHLSGDEIAAAMERAYGQPVRYQAMPAEVYRSLGFPGADDLGNMFQAFDEFSAEFCRARDLQLCRELNPRLQSLDQWLAEHKERIPIQG
jgi:uncharacterized protein YbjT (DUF2867 family)